MSQIIKIEGQVPWSAESGVHNPQDLPIREHAARNAELNQDIRVWDLLAPAGRSDKSYIANEDFTLPDFGQDRLADVRCSRHALDIRVEMNLDGMFIPKNRNSIYQCVFDKVAATNLVAVALPRKKMDRAHK
ncbi:hypothetical protein [Brucella anthropi]|uniref:Uncharacterized protein n=1 Tax=Brucella anthropi TaxID=529 RepID=A0A6L3Z1T0_BRUAN|nr:hypothetical protein [Brucella anthropi]KAB2765753.1 hypothetical protein F9L04_18395 [Brucella anthropi]